jgi:hypothetical protein
MPGTVDDLLQKLIDQRGPCDEYCVNPENLKLIISDLYEPVVDENNNYIIWTP